MRSLGQGVKNFKESMHEKSEPEDESLLEKTEVTDELKRIDEE
jgi:Sec-independent protein translocase protein TatA